MYKNVSAVTYYCIAGFFRCRSSVVIAYTAARLLCLVAGSCARNRLERARLADRARVSQGR